MYILLFLVALYEKYGSCSPLYLALNIIYHDKKYVNLIQ